MKEHVTKCKRYQAAYKVKLTSWRKPFRSWKRRCPRPKSRSCSKPSIIRWQLLFWRYQLYLLCKFKARLNTEFNNSCNSQLNLVWLKKNDLALKILNQLCCICSTWSFIIVEYKKSKWRYFTNLVISHFLLIVFVFFRRMRITGSTLRASFVTNWCSDSIGWRSLSEMRSTTTQQSSDWLWPR